MNSKVISVLRIILLLLVIASSIACVIFPVIGARNYFTAFRTPYSASLHYSILGEQLVGPVYTLLLSLALMFLLLCRKRIAWWLWLIGVMGPIYTIHTGGALSHEFSHAVFNECSGIYGSWIGWLSIVGGSSLIILAIVTKIADRFDRLAK